MTFTVREFRWSDLEEALALWRSAFGGLKPEDSREALERTLGLNPGLFLVAEVDGRLGGTTLATSDGRRGFLYHVATRPELRRRGIASALVREACARLQSRGITTIHLRVAANNEDARSLYRSLDFSDDAPTVVGMRFPPSSPEHP